MRCCKLIDWPNSLEIVLIGVANCHNLPLVGGRRGAHGCVFQGRKAHGVATNVYSRKTSEKPKRVVYELWSWNDRELFLCMGKVLAPHTSVTRDDSLQSSVQIWLQNYVFSLFWCFLAFYGSFVFFIFLWSTRVFPSLLHIPQLQWGNQTYIILLELNIG